MHFEHKHLEGRKYTWMPNTPRSSTACVLRLASWPDQLGHPQQEYRRGMKNKKCRQLLSVHEMLDLIRIKVLRDEIVRNTAVPE